MKRLLIATDAWLPQVNGVVRTYQYVSQELVRAGIELRFLTPADFFTVSCPGYRQIHLALPRVAHVSRVIKEFAPSAIHIATEGPIGWATRAACLRLGHAFTTAYHTKFPEYLAAHASLPERWTYPVVKRFHDAAARTMVATRSLASTLKAHGFRHIVPWTRGVDTHVFRPRPVRDFGDRSAVYLYVGRVSVEKNLLAFLDLDLPGRKVVVGDGPLLSELRLKYRDTLFTGTLQGELLARAYASADVFVFPSRTDTFGLVMLEALASGTPVAAYPVTGPMDVIAEGVSGCLNEDLGIAIARASRLNRTTVASCAAQFSWARCAEQFSSNLVHVRAASRNATRVERRSVRWIDA